VPWRNRLSSKKGQEILLSTLRSIVGAVLSAKRLGAYAWASLISQILIVVTGGLVRLTGSGLGCPTWPKCTDASLTTVPAQGYHGLIEFGNRLLTFVLLVVAVLTILAVWQRAVDRSRGLRLPALLLLLGIPAQAVLGGFTVLTKLNPWLVGSHFILSGIMIVIASVLVWRTYRPEVQVVPALAYKLSPALSVLGGLAVVIGVLVTGAGPHAGDAQSVRNGLDLATWYHYHSYPAYLLLAATMVQFAVLIRSEQSGIGAKNWSLTTKVALGLLGAEYVQAVIGMAQAQWGVPAGLVALHMLGASCLISLLTFSHLTSRAH
jgi:cytochrome c oxidase assembly protein subunit 15